MDDIRYSELKFLQSLTSGIEDMQLFYDPKGERSKAVGLTPSMYVDMAATLIEDLYVRFDNDRMRALVSRLRGELSPDARGPFTESAWKNPREELHNVLTYGNNVQRLRITYRGLRRIEELRDMLRQDRILEDFGVMLSIRYFRKDIEEALRRSPDTATSVIYADMDDLRKINRQHGQAAGDVVVKAYLEVVRDTLGSLGESYRGVGDEVVGLVIGQGHERAVELAEAIRKRVGALKCEYKGSPLPRVTVSIGIATTPPEPRTLDIETLAEERMQQAKRQAKNRVSVK